MSHVFLRNLVENCFRVKLFKSLNDNLSDTTLYITRNGSYTEKHEIVSGVHQDSVLSQFLFLCILVTIIRV